MISKVKNDIKNYLHDEYLKKYALDLNFIIEEPKRAGQGDLSIPCFTLLKVIKKSINEITEDIKELLSISPLSNLFQEINVIGGFVNITVSREELTKKVIRNLLEKEIGKNNEFNDEVICLDYSSPNIAKPFSIGHLRSTIIGQAIANIYEKCGAKTVRINHLGDYGTQFGKMIYAYLNFGDKAKVQANPIEELVALYVKFHALAENDPNLEIEARKIFKELEQGNEEYVKIWKWFREESLKEFNKMYERLNVKFDSYNGEAFYNDKMDAIVNELEDKNLLVLDDGAMVVKLEGDVPPAIIKKNDGSTLYITRDLAALFYRKHEYNFTKCLYVVGNEQKLHFEELKEVVKLMGYDFYQNIFHVNFGLVLQDGKKMSTRKGRAVKLIDVLDKAKEISLEYINEKNPDLENKEEIAEKIGTSAIIFNDLRNYRANDFEFDLESMVKFEGQTGPYLQYTYVRINSILKNEQIDFNNIDYKLYLGDHYFEIIKEIAQYESILVRSAVECAPSYLAKYLLNLASLFNGFYAKEKILVDNVSEKNSKEVLLYLVKQILADGMKILGMSVIEKM